MQNHHSRHSGGRSAGRTGSAPAAPPVTPRSWRDLTRDLKGPGSIPMIRDPIPSVFLGAGILADSKYLPWRAGEIQRRYSKMAANSTNRFREWVGYANALLASGDPDLQVDGYSLMYYLLIEPFSLLPQEPDWDGLDM